MLCEKGTLLHLQKIIVQFPRQLSLNDAFLLIVKSYPVDISMPRTGGLVVGVSDSWPGGC